MPSPIFSGVAALMALCVGTGSGMAQDANDTTLIRVIDRSRLALPPRATGEMLGYPAVTVDKQAIRQMLRARSFGELDRLFAGLQSQVQQRIQLEYEWVAATRAFDAADSTLEAPLNEWVANAPNSAHARVARATYYRSRAWLWRGEGYIRETTDAALRRMAVVTRQSAEDAMAALRLDSTNLIAYTELIGLLQFGGEKEPARKVFDDGRKYYRASHYLTSRYMDLLLPRWGGSFEEMDALAAEVAADSALNPRLVTLLGAAEDERAYLAEEKNDYRASINHANAALKYGPEISSYLQRGDALANMGDYDRAMADLDLVLSYSPQHPRALELHGFAAMVSADWQVGDARVAALTQARSDYELLLSLEPTRKFPRENLPRIKTSLRLCPRDYHLCPQAREDGAPTVEEARQMRSQLYKVLGIVLLLSSWGIYRWIKSGFWIPRYIHLLAAFAMAMVCFIDVVWLRAGQSMTLARWLVIPIFPLTVYFIFIGLGGAVMAPRNKPGRSP